MRTNSLGEFLQWTNVVMKHLWNSTCCRSKSHAFRGSSGLATIRNNSWWPFYFGTWYEVVVSLGERGKATSAIFREVLSLSLSDLCFECQWQKIERRNTSRHGTNWSCTYVNSNIFSTSGLESSDLLYPFVPLDKQVSHTLRFCRMFFSSQEGLYVMITLFLVLQCRSWKMFCQRLVRKVGRQLVVMYFIASALPLRLYTSSPMNCLQEPTLNPAVVARSAKNFLFGGKESWRFRLATLSGECPTW